MTVHSIALRQRQIKCTVTVIRLGRNMGSFARLLAYMRIPTIVTLERPVDRKGTVPAAVKATLGGAAKSFEKSFFDLTKEKPILITVTVLDCTPQVRHDNLSDRHFEDDLWQQEGRTVSFRRLTN